MEKVIYLNSFYFYIGDKKYYNVFKYLLLSTLLFNLIMLFLFSLFLSVYLKYFNNLFKLLINCNFSLYIVFHYILIRKISLGKNNKLFNHISFSNNLLRFVSNNIDIWIIKDQVLFVWYNTIYLNNIKLFDFCLLDLLLFRHYYHL